MFSKFGVLFLLFAGVIDCLDGSIALAQEFPTKPLMLIVAQSPGTPPDVGARTIAPELSKFIGQPVIVENKTGAGNVIGYEYVAKQAPADGYTLLVVTVESLASLPVTSKDLRFDPLKDLPPVINLVEGKLVLGSSAKFPWKNFNEFVAYAKANPGKLNYGSAAPTVRLASEILLRGLGADVTYVPYAAAGPYFQGMLSGDVHMGFISESAVFSMGDKLRVLAVSGDKRSVRFPDIPTFSELRHPQIPGASLSLNARIGTPKPVLDKLSSAASRALQQPELRARFAKIQYDVVDQSGESAIKKLEDIARIFADVAKKVGIQPE